MARRTPGGAAPRWPQASVCLQRPNRELLTMQRGSNRPVGAPTDIQSMSTDLSIQLVRPAARSRFIVACMRGLLIDLQNNYRHKYITIILIILCNNYYSWMNLVSQAEYAELGNRIRHPIQSRSPLVIVHSVGQGHSRSPTVTPHVNRFPAGTLRYQETELIYIFSTF